MTPGAKAGSKPGAEAERERELKLGIPDETGLRALLEAAGGRAADAALQVNHFFDTPSRALRSLEVGLRVRQERGGYVLTLKGPSIRSGEALADRVEVERPLDEARALQALRGDLDVRRLLEGVAPRDAPGAALVDSVQEACADEPLEHIGAFRNERTRVATALGDAAVVLEFDRTDFGDGEVRCEVELEIGPDQSGARLAAELEALFRRAGVRVAPTTSKLAHFLDLQDARDRSA